MKKVNFTKFLIILLTPILLAGCATNSVEPIEEDIAIPLGNTGVTVEIPSKYGFEAKTSERNDFFGRSSNGDWCIIVNHDEKGDYSLEEYAQEVAEANGASKAKLAADGNYYFEYINGDYHFYTAVRQNDEYYYRVAFYCFEDLWSQYESEFSDWATTIKLNQNV